VYRQKSSKRFPLSASFSSHATSIKHGEQRQCHAFRLLPAAGDASSSKRGSQSDVFESLFVVASPAVVPIRDLTESV
jgi:hypothetical protein